MRLEDLDKTLRSRRALRGLTVRQPWASAIAAGRKTIEVRTWRTGWRGPVLIHAGRDRRHLREAAAGGGSALGLSKRRREQARPAPWYPLGVVLAVARIVDCRRLEPDDGAALDIPGWADLWPERGFELSTELWGWVLADVSRALPPLAPLRGRLGLWRPTADEMAVLALTRWRCGAAG